MVKSLNFTLKKSRYLYIQTFENWTKGSGSTQSCSIGIKETPQDAYNKVLAFENHQRIKRGKQRDVVYRYWVVEMEIMTDDRKKFGHSNMSSSKESKVIVPNTYVRGQIITIDDALQMSKNGFFTEYVKSTLSNFISIDLKLDEKNLTKKNLATKIMMIFGEGKRETFFDHVFKTTKLKIFSEKELSPIKEFVS